MGLPMYIAIDRNPENGCEIQNYACVRSGVMLLLILIVLFFQTMWGITRRTVNIFSKENI